MSLWQAKGKSSYIRLILTIFSQSASLMVLPFKLSNLVGSAKGPLKAGSTNRGDEEKKTYLNR